MFFLVPHFLNIYRARLYLSHGMKFGFLRRPHSIFMCHCFHCCSSRNEQRDEKRFCSDSLALFVWQTFVSGYFARQMVVITVVTSKQSCVLSSVQRLLEYFGGLVWAVGYFLPRASTLRLRLADDLGLVPLTTSLCGRLTADDDCFSRCAPCGSKCLVLRMPLRSRTKLVAHVVCSKSTDCVWVVSALAGTLRRLSWAYLLQFRQLCPSSSETRCATCLSANGGGVAPLSWLIHVATA